MSSLRYSLPGISKISMLPCADLPPGIMYQSICGCTPALAVKLLPVDFIGRPSLKWEGEIVNGSRQEKSTLEFTTRSPLPEGLRLAFVVTSPAGLQYIIGSREPKFPQVSYSDTTGATDGEPAVRTYKITHVAIKSVLRCII